MNNQDVLIRLLKEGHISEMEFKNLYQLTEKENVIDQVSIPFQHQPIPNPWWSTVNPWFTTCNGDVITYSNQ